MGTMLRAALALSLSLAGCAVDDAHDSADVLGPPAATRGDVIAAIYDARCSETGTCALLTEPHYSAHVSACATAAVDRTCRTLDCAAPATAADLAFEDACVAALDAIATAVRDRNVRDQCYGLPEACRGPLPVL